MIQTMIIVGGLLVLGISFIIIRWGKLPPWTHRDLLAFVALLGTIGGAVILTFMKWEQTTKFNEQSDRLIAELVRERPGFVLAKEVGGALTTIIDSVTWDLKLTSAGIIIVMLSLGLVISARTIKGKIFGGEFEMGSGAAAAAAAAAQDTAGAAKDRADEISDQAGPAAAPPPDAPAPAPDVDAAPTARP